MDRAATRGRVTQDTAKMKHTDVLHFCDISEQEKQKVMSRCAHFLLAMSDSRSQTLLTTTPP